MRFLDVSMASFINHNSEGTYLRKGCILLPLFQYFGVFYGSSGRIIWLRHNFLAWIADQGWNCCAQEILDAFCREGGLLYPSHYWHSPALGKVFGRLLLMPCQFYYSYLLSFVLTASSSWIRGKYWYFLVVHVWFSCSQNPGFYHLFQLALDAKVAFFQVSLVASRTC